MYGLKLVAGVIIAVGVVSGASASGQAIATNAQAPSDREVQARPRLELAPGCRWLREPEEVETSSTWSIGGKDGILGGVVAVDKPSGALQIILTFAGLSERPEPEYRPVVFDARGKRHLLESIGRSNNGDNDGVQFAINLYSLDPGQLPAADAAYYGVEEVTAEAQRIASVQARRQAKEAGVALLPEPQVGAPFEFRFTTIDGKTIDSHDLRGKVVLVDCWATWCTPCMAKMPKLKALYQERHGDGFEIVGLCFNDEDVARGAVQRLGLPWPQVVVPSDETVRELWLDAGISSLPRLFVIDREGILRADCDTNQVVPQVLRSLETPKGPSTPVRPPSRDE